jgi:hypothetical protein
MRFLLLLACLAGVETGCFAQGNSYFGNFNGNAGFVSTNQPGLSNVVATNIVGTLTNSTTGNAATATTAANATGTLTNNISGNAAYATNAGSVNGTLTNNLSGNAAYATNAGSAATAINFTGSLFGNVTGTQGATVVTYLPVTVVTNGTALTNVSATALNGTIPISNLSASLQTLSSNNGGNLTNISTNGLTNISANAGLFLTVTGSGAIGVSNFTATGIFSNGTNTGILSSSGGFSGYRSNSVNFPTFTVTTSANFAAWVNTNAFDIMFVIPSLSDGSDSLTVSMLGQDFGSVTSGTLDVAILVPMKPGQTVNFASGNSTQATTCFVMPYP